MEVLDNIPVILDSEEVSRQSHIRREPSKSVKEAAQELTELVRSVVRPKSYLARSSLRVMKPALD